VTRRRPTFWPGQSGSGAPRGFPGDNDNGHGDGGDDGELSGGEHLHPDDSYGVDELDDVLGANARLFSRTRRADDPVVKWRNVSHPLFVDSPWRQPDRDYRGTDATEILSDEDHDEPSFDDSAYEDAVDDYADLDSYEAVDSYEDEDEDDVDPEPPAAPAGADRARRDRRDIDDRRLDDRHRDRPSNGGASRRDRARSDDWLDDDPLPDPAWKVDSPDVVRAALLDSGRPVRRDVDRRPSRWRMRLADRLVASWPGQGQSPAGVPAGFPASGEVVLRPRRKQAEAEAEDGRPRLVSLSDRLAPDAPLAGSGPRERDAGSALGAVARGDGRRKAAASPTSADKASASVAAEPTDAEGRRLHGVVAAVYAALADPLINADAATREQQAARLRRFGMVAGSVALAVVLVYGIFPVRTYLEQRSATSRARERIDRLAEANAELEERKGQLSDDETVEEIARRDYQLVFPGEESYGLLPPPVDEPAATTTTTPPAD
jgi:cell division protein FtsB